MTYVEGFVIAVPTAEKDNYAAHALEARKLFEDYGIRRIAEYWGDDVPDGATTDFARAVQKKDDETVAFSWFEYADRAARDIAHARMMADKRMMALGDTMPFDGKRMIIGGFTVIVDNGSDAGTYIDGCVLPVPSTGQQAFLDHANEAAALFREHGALRVVETWGDDVPDGSVTDFRRAVQAQSDETVVYSWIEWPDKVTRNAGWAKLEKDDRMSSPAALPFDGKRMIFGGFAALSLDGRE